MTAAATGKSKLTHRCSNSTATCMAAVLCIPQVSVVREHMQILNRVLVPSPGEDAMAILPWIVLQRLVCENGVIAVNFK
jgi:hypothetical protein